MTLSVLESSRSFRDAMTTSLENERLYLLYYNSLNEAWNRNTALFLFSCVQQMYDSEETCDIIGTRGSRSPSAGVTVAV